MNKPILLFAFLFFTSSTFSQSKFYKNYLNEVDDREVFNSVQTSDGGYALLGIADTENASSEVAVTKLGCMGEIEWAKKYGVSGTINNVFGGIIEADNGDIVIAYSVGTFQNYDVLMSRINPSDGAIVWSKRFGGSRDDQARDLVQTNDGNFVLIGGTSSYGTGSSGQTAFTDIYLLKVDGDGNVLWTRTYGEAGQIDAGYAIREDASGNLLMTGRYLVGGTFYAYLMKTDADGNPVFFKGFGQPNHRTYGYDLEITNNNDYVITGSTTIDKVDFTSYADVFLIKTNTTGDTIFTRIYHPWVGDDRSESGSSIVVQEDGGYGIGVPTLSFTTHTVGFVPNKNVIFSIAQNGFLQKAQLFNQGGSHYTQVRKASFNGYIFSNFSNFFSPSFEFLPIIIQTDEDYLVGCNEIDVTGEVNTAFHSWDVQDINNYVESDGSFDNTMSGGADFTYSMIDTQCEEYPEVVSSFSLEGLCIDDPVIYSDSSSSNIIEWNWDFGDGEMSTAQNPEYIYSEPGIYTVTLSVSDGCQEDSSTGEIEILPLDRLFADTTICDGESIFAQGAEQTESGVFIDTLAATGPMTCKQIQETTLTVEKCNCEALVFPNAFTPDNDEMNDFFGGVTDCEPEQIRNYNMKVYSRWGEMIFESSNYDLLWDGTCDSENCASDVYYYTVTYELLMNDNFIEKSEKGDVILLR